jgi:hypothetical protein
MCQFGPWTNFRGNEGRSAKIEGAEKATPATKEMGSKANSDGLARASSSGGSGGGGGGGDTTPPSPPRLPVAPPLTSPSRVPVAPSTSPPPLQPPLAPPRAADRDTVSSRLLASCYVFGGDF